MTKMKTLTMGGKTYEIVDEQARADIADIQEHGASGNTQTLEEMLEGFDGDPGSVKTYVDNGLGGKADSDHDHDKEYQAKGNYVVVEEGKGLSTNDFTDYYKNLVIGYQQTDMDLRDVEMALEGLVIATPGSVKTYIDNAVAGCAKPEDIPTMDEILAAVRDGLPAAEEVKL